MKPAVLLLTAATLGTGCMSVTSKVPGVLDLRSDGADAPVNAEPLAPASTRAGFDAFAFGEGVKGGADILIEDRSHLLLSLVTIGNPSSTEEWQTALGGQAMRNVTITEQETLMAWFVGVLKGFIPVVGGLMTGTWDFRARGTRILVGASTRDESIPLPAAVEVPAPTTATPGVGY